MRSPGLVAAWTALSACLAAPLVAAGAQAVAVSVEDLARRSDLVVRGRVGAVTARWAADGKRIVTEAEVATSATWRGYPRGEVRVVVPGGVVGRVGQQVDGAPSLSSGEEVVLFLFLAEGGAYRVTGLAQGKYTVERGQAQPDLSRVDFVANEVRRGERAAGPMPLEELERRVRSAR